MKSNEFTSIRIIKKKHLFFVGKHIERYLASSNQLLSILHTQFSMQVEAAVDSKCSENVWLYPNLLHISSISIISFCRIERLRQIFHIKGTDFQRQMSAYKFPVFITKRINSLSLPKVLCNTTKTNMLNLI